MLNNRFSHTLLVNEDPNWIYPSRGGYKLESRDEIVEAFKTYFGKYRDTVVTDYLLCILEQSSIVPSEYITWRGEKCRWTHENGVPVHYAHASAGEADYGKLEPIWRLYRDFNIDPVNICIETMRACGIRPWITLRMNDCHFNDQETAFTRSTLFYEAKKNGWMIGSGGEDYGYFSNCLDFAHPEIREIMLAYIREMVDRYDADGLELDFQREIHSFDYRNAPACHTIMNDFIREVRKITNEAAVKKGHNYRLMVRLHRSVEDNLVFGFDVRTWAAEKLVDAVVPAPRWEYTDSGIPVEEWKAVMGADIAVFPGVETLHLKFTLTTYEHTKAYAAGWFANSADGLYAYNMFCGSERDTQVWNLTPEKCLIGCRDFCVTGQDISTDCCPSYKPLPMDIATDNALLLTVGKISPADVLTLTIDFEGEMYPVVTIGGIPAQSMVERPIVTVPAEDPTCADVAMTAYQALVYNFTGVETNKDIVVYFTGNGTVHYVDLMIQA